MIEKKPYFLNYFFILIKINLLIKSIKKFFNKNNQDYKNYTKQKIGKNNELFVTKLFNKMKKEYIGKKNLNIKFCSSDIFLIEKKI